MLITLNNGKTVRIPFDQYDSMSDREYQEFLDSDYGYEINDPFFDSQIQSKEEDMYDGDDGIDYEEYNE